MLAALALSAQGFALQPHVCPTASVARMGAPLLKAEDDAKKKGGIDFSGLSQLMAMGAGAPMLGDLKETNFNDPTKPDLIFELEANNFFSKDGNIKKGKYFEDGYVEEEGEAGPGFFENLLSGGKLQREFDQKRRGGK